jgi:long-chain acyl-CoA synthetase
MGKLSIPLKFKETVNKVGERKALGAKNRLKKEYEYLSFSDLANRVNEFSSAMLELGVKSGDKIAIMAENSPEWVISDLGILSAGALDVPVYTTLTYLQLEYILDNCGAKGIVVSNNTHYQKVIKLFDVLPALEFIIYVDELAPEKHSRVKSISFGDLLAEGKKNLEKNLPVMENRIASIDEDDICSIIYTSGTTGSPKGVMLSHKNFLSNATESARILIGPDMDGKEILELSFLPLSHVLERCLYYGITVITGGTIAYAESIDTISENLVEVKPTFLASVPRIYEKIYDKVLGSISASNTLRQKIFKYSIESGKKYYEATQHHKKANLLLDLQHMVADKAVLSKIREKTGGNLKMLVSGGAPLLPEIAAFFSYVGLPVVEGYGLTETSPVICINRPDNLKFGTVGQVIPGIDVKIAEDGEILARGPNIMKGYYNNPVATAEAIDPDGWFHTGDIGELDSEGFLKITDRKKDIIVMSNGKNVAPQPIESLLKSDKYIEQIVLVGDNRKYISALIVPNFANLFQKAQELGITIKEKAQLCREPKIIDFMKKELESKTTDQVAHFEKIKNFVLLCDEFSQENDELTPTLKLKRKVITKRYSGLIDLMYGVSTARNLNFENSIKMKANSFIDKVTKVTAPLEPPV